ncbi:MAG: tetratricopeptide repeat protein, partial [Cyanobacteria bacterium P01_H01_bin.15]
GLDISGDLRQRQNHVLKQSYENLEPEQQLLLSWIACFRSPVDVDTLLSIAEDELKAEADLSELIERGLLSQYNQTGRFDLHPIVRRYAYDQLGVKDRTEAHQKLADYFEAVPEPTKITCLADLTPAIELYHHLVQTEQLGQAYYLFSARINEPTFYQFGAYQLRIDLLKSLFQDGEEKPPRLSKGLFQGSATNELANSYFHSGEVLKALQLRKLSIKVFESESRKNYVAISLGNLASNQVSAGILREAERNLNRTIELFQKVENPFNKAISHRRLGLLQIYLANWKTASTEFLIAKDYFESIDDCQNLSVTYSELTQQSLLYRQGIKLFSKSTEQLAREALGSAKRTLELAEETSRTRFAYERDYVRAYWLLGAANLINEQYLNIALIHCRSINLVKSEPDILLEFARLYAATNRPTEAQISAEETLEITERCGYVLTGSRC